VEVLLPQEQLVQVAEVAGHKQVHLEIHLQQVHLKEMTEEQVTHLMLQV
jgi:hypothetical protein